MICEGYDCVCNLPQRARSPSDKYKISAFHRIPIIRIIPQHTSPLCITPVFIHHLIILACHIILCLMDRQASMAVLCAPYYSSPVVAVHMPVRIPLADLILYSTIPNCPLSLYVQSNHNAICEIDRKLYKAQRYTKVPAGKDTSGERFLHLVKDLPLPLAEL